MARTGIHTRFNATAHCTNTRVHISRVARIVVFILLPIAIIKKHNDNHQNMKEKQDGNLDAEVMAQTIDVLSKLDTIEEFAFRVQQQTAHIIIEHYGAATDAERQKAAQSSQARGELRLKVISRYFLDETIRPHKKLSIAVQVTIVVQTFQMMWKSIMEEASRKLHPGKHFQHEVPPLPTAPLANFDGGSQHDPIGFVLHNYGVWMKLGVMDIAHLEILHPGIGQKMHNQIRANKRANQKDGGKRPESIKIFFPSKAQAELIRKALYSDD